MNKTNKKSRSLNSRRLQIESLESRELLSVSTAEFAAQYADLNLLDDDNVIEITATELSSDAALRNENQTAASQNTMMLSDTDLTSNLISAAASHNAGDVAWLNQYGLGSYENDIDWVEWNSNGRITRFFYINRLIVDSSLDCSALTELTYLNCYRRALSALNVSKNTKLTTLICDYNDLSTLDVSKNTALTVLWCSHNNLSEIIGAAGRTYSIEAGHSSDYNCRVDADNNVTIVRYTLTTPSNFTGTATTNSVDLSWSAVSGATGYEIWYKKATDPSSDSSYTKVSVSGASKTIPDLDANTEYNFQLRAVNSSVVSTWTTKNVTTQPQATVPTAPSNFRSTAQTNNSVTLAWNSQSNVTGFTLQYKTSSASSWTTYSNPLASATFETVEGLSAGTSYNFRLCANNSGGSSDYVTANATTATALTDDSFEENDTLSTAYNLGTLVAGSVNTFNSLVSVVNNGVVDEDYYKFTISNAGDAGSYVKINFTHSISDLDLSLYNSAGTQIQYSIGTTNEETILLNGLAAGTYTIKVVNHSKLTNSYTLSIKAPAAPLSAPANFTGTAATNSVALSWSAVSGATSYEIWYKKASDSSYTSVSVFGTSTTITNSTPNTTYHFQLRAVNSSVVSPWTTKTVTTQPQATVPTAPTGLTSNGTPTTSSIELKWNAQSGLTGFTLEYKTANASSWSVYSSNISGSATSINVTNLAAGTEYNFRLKATNAVGTSAASNTYTNRTAATVASGQNYAVLFAGGYNSGNNHDRYYNAIKDLYFVLTTSYGLSKDNIYIIYADGTNSSVDRSDGINSDMSYANSNRVLSATQANFGSVFTTLGNTMTTNDHLLFYTFDHGDGATFETTLTTEETLTGWQCSIPDEVVASNVARIQNGYVTMVFAQCFAGGILDEIIDPVTGIKKITTNAHLYGMSATNHYEYSWGDGFARSFIKAVNPYVGNKLTTTDAFAYAKQNDSYTATGSYANNGGTYIYGTEHPWGIGETFSIFTAGAGNNNYNSNALTNYVSGDLLITNTATSNTDTFELLAGNKVYINYAYSNPQNATVNATVTISGRNATPETFVISDAGTGSLATNFDLGVFGAGEYAVNVELFVGEDYLIFSDAFIVLAQSTDVADTLATAKAIRFDSNTWTTTSSIGDGSYGGKDVDIYQIVASDTDINKTFVFNTVGGQTQATDTYIRLFTVAGVELAHSILSGQNLMSSLYYTITTVGTYYLGISALDNTSYLPATPNSGIAGTTGTYQVNGAIVDTRPDLSMNYDFSWIDNIIWTTSATGNNRVTPKSNEDVYVNYKFSNAGYAAAGAVKNRITITGVNGYSMSHDFTSSSINSGDFQSLPQNYNWGKLAAGDYTITVTLDVDKAINELNELNNTASWNFTVAESQTTPTMPAPKNLCAVTIAQTTLSLDWNNVEGATGYILEQKISLNNWQQIYSGASSKFVHTGLTANTQYEYRVKATSTSGNSEYTTLTVKTAAKTDSNGNTIADTPVFLTPIENSNGSITIRWTNLGSDYIYTLYKAGQIVVQNGSNNSFIDNTPSPNGVEGYVLMARNTVTGARSVQATSVVWTTAKPLEITGYEVVDNTKIMLQWDVDPDVIYYSIYRKGINISGRLTDFDSGIASWIDNNPLEDNDYMLFAAYEDQSGNRTTTFSNLYSLKKPTQSQTLNALDAFWANYDFDLVDDDILNAIAS